MTQDQPQPEKGSVADLMRESKKGMDFINSGKSLDSLEHPVKAEPRLTAEEWLNKLVAIMPYNMLEQVRPYIIELANAFAQQEVDLAVKEKDEELKVAYGNGYMCGEMDQRQWALDQVSAKDQEWKDRIERRINEIQMDEHTTFAYYRGQINELESLLNENHI